MALPQTLRPRPWSPLNDQEWHALYPYLIPRSPAGRQVGDLRRRMDAIFQVACAGQPWKDVPESAGKPDTVARYFRRLTRGGLWQKLLDALCDLDAAHPLMQIRDFIFRACRRANRMLGVKFAVLIRHLGMLSALNGPPCLMPDPDLSETLTGQILPAFAQRDHRQVKRLTWLLRSTMGLRRFPAAWRRVWP